MGLCGSKFHITEQHRDNMELIIRELPNVCSIPIKVLEYYRQNIVELDTIIESQKADADAKNLVYYYLMCFEKSPGNNYCFNQQKYKLYKKHAKTSEIRYYFISKNKVEDMGAPELNSPSQPIQIPIPSYSGYNFGQPYTNQYQQPYQQYQQLYQRPYQLPPYIE